MSSQPTKTEPSTDSRNAGELPDPGRITEGTNTDGADSETRPRPAGGAILRGPGLAVLSLATWVPILTVLIIRASPQSRERILGEARWPIEGLLIAGAILGLLALVQRSGGPASNGSLHGREVDWGFVLRLCLGVGVAWIATYQVMFPYFGALHGAVSAGLAASVFGVLVLLLERRSRVSWIRRLDLVMFNLCALLVLGELAMRGYASLRPNVLFERMDASVEEKINRTRLEPGSIRMGSRVDPSGFFDRAPTEPDERQGPFVLSISDSFAMSALPLYYHYTTVAERELPGTEIYNMGMSSIGPREYLHLLLNEGLRLDPDVVVVHLFLGNDFNIPVPGSRDGAVLAPLLDRRNLLLYQVPRRLRLMRSGTSRGFEELASESGRAEGKGRELRTVDELHRAYPWLENPLEEPPVFTDGEIFRIELGYARATSRTAQATFSKHLDKSVLPMQQALGDRPLLVVLIPANFQVDDLLWERIVKNRPQGLDRDNVQRCVIRWLRFRRIPYLDLLPVLREVPPLEDGRPHLYRKNDTHFNRRGNEVAGRALASFLETHMPAVGGETRAGQKNE